MRILIFIVASAAAFPAFSLTKEAKEFMRIAETLEPVHCEKRKLRRQIAFAEAERRDADAAKARTRFAELDRDPQTARLERRLAELEPILKHSPDPEDLRAINRQRVEAFYRCE